MGAVGGVAILGGNFEAPTFPEDKVVQRSLTVGNQEASDIDAVILDALPLGAPGQLDSHAMLWKGHSNDGSPHTIDWKAFVNVTADDGTGSLWTLQTRIDGAPYTDILTVDDNGLLTVSGATFTMDQLIIDSDNTEAVLVRKDGDAGDVFIVDTVNDVVRMGSDATFLTFGASSDARLERFGPRILGMREPGVGGVGLGAGGENTLRLYARDDAAAARWLELMGDGPLCLVKANRATGGGQFDLNLDVSVGKIAFFNEGVQRWNIQGSVTADFEFAPFITNRYDLGSAALAVRNLYTNGVLIGQDQTAAYDAITIDGTDLAAPGQQDSGAIILTGLSNDGSAHDIDWKQFVNVTANAGTGSIWTLQARIDAASFVDEFTITATTSPTLAHIGPGSTDGALAFGPIGAAGPAQSGTLRFRNTDDMRWRNSGDDDDNVWLSIGISDELILGETTTGPHVSVVPELRCLEQLNVTHDSSGAFNVSGTGFSPVVFNVGTAGADMLVTIGSGVALLASVEERLILRGPNLTVNSTVGFSHALLLQGQARTGAGVVHDANWRMYVEPLTGTGFDGQSVFKITAEIDTGGPTTVFTLSDTGDLTVPGSFVIDGLIVDVTSTEALLVRKNADGGDVFNVDTSNDLVQVIGSAALTIGATPAASGSIRMSNASDIVWRNSGDSGDNILLSVGSSDELILGESTTGPFIRVVPEMRHFDTVSIPFTSTVALSVSQDNFANNILLVDTTNGNIEIGSTIALFGTPVDRLIITAPDLTVDSTFGASHAILMVGKSRTSGSVDHDSNWRVFVDPFHFGPFDGRSDLKITAAIDGAIPTEIVKMTDEGRFAIIFPEQVSIGSSSFIDNVQVNITGSFVDDYGGGPTTTHKVQIQGSQTGDAGRTNRQTVFDLSNATIITQNASQTIDEVGGMNIIAPSITPGTDTITKAYTLKVTNTPTVAGAENYGLLVDSTALATNLTALTRIGKSFNQGIKLLVGGGVGFENIEGTAQMRLTNVYTPDGLQTEAMLLHVHTTLQATDGTTDHITGAFFQGSLRTQVEPDENVANISQVRIDEPNIQDNLTGTGEITNAQSLLITGAPTEGESNYAFRILGGNIQVSASSELHFRNAGDSADIPVLRVDSSDNTILNADSGDRLFLRVNDVTQVDISNNQFEILRIGPHSVGIGNEVPFQWLQGGSYTAGAAGGTTAAAFSLQTTLTGASGKTVGLFLLNLDGAILTQTATESIANISTLRVAEPSITDQLGGGGVVTIAQTVLITGAPTEGVENYAWRVGGGDVQISNSSAFLMRRTSAADMNIFSSPQSDELTFGDANMPIILIPANVRMTKQLEVRFGSTASFFVSTGAGVAVFQVNTTDKEVDVIGDAFKFIADTSVVGSNNLEIRQARTSVSTAAGSSVTAAGLIPAGSFVIGVNVRVLTPVTGPAGFDVGDGIDVDRWGNSIAVAGSTTTDITDYTTGAVTTFQVANDVVITSDGVDFTGGTIRIVVNYMTLTGPIN